MTDKERIELLERKVAFLEEALKQTLKELNKLVDLMTKIKP